ncbi:MAG: DUF2726 domain-containing protein [Firmicutes bacterium]|nr:DUF2726 domain-containing protein [[Eubacterium] siraeum]MCM1488944.1 DUF2726 domain-containing protein [Bacillota bacterium]
MKCKVCGAESGKYVLCRNCNEKKEQGLIIKCEKCNNWHYKDAPCRSTENNTEEFLYKLKNTVMTDCEKDFFKGINSSLPEGYIVLPQMNLAAFIEKTDNSKYRSELFRNVDFLIVTKQYEPKIIIEINDQTHLTADRKERDEKVKNICDEAGIPIIKLWTSYGVNTEYIKGKINKTLSSLPIERKHTARQENDKENVNDVLAKSNPNVKKQKSGCYIATCVYGSYDCHNVMVLRNYRDNKLSKSIWGRIFIKTYYKISPQLVKWFGNKNWFKEFWKKRLDKMIEKIESKYNNTI